MYPDVFCEEIQYVESGFEAVISCEYDLTFYTVRWHVSNSTESFLRIDGKTKSGTGITSGKFDIKDDGSMVMKTVDHSNEGIYTISVLDADGLLNRATTTVRIIGKDVYKVTRKLKFMPRLI